MAINNSREPLIQQGWLRAIIFCAAYILVTYIAGFVMAGAFGLAAAGGAKPAADIQTITLLALTLVAIVSVSLTIIFRIYVDRQPVASLGFYQHKHRNDAWVGLLLAIVLLGLGSLILYFAGNLRWTDARFIGSEFFIATVLMLIIAVSEEMVFRGYLLNNLMDSFDKRLALLISALLFTVAHAFNPNLTVLSIINLFLGGLLLGINFIYTRTLWFAIGFHFSWNFLQGYVLGFAVSGLGEDNMLQQQLKGSPVMTGGQFGFEGSIVATGLMLAAIALFYFVYERNSKNLPTF